MVKNGSAGDWAKGQRRGGGKGTKERKGRKWKERKKMEIRCLTSKTAYCFFTDDSV
jgi:hypothetical protein